MDTMKVAAFRGPGRIAIEERPKPIARAGEAVMRITTTTMCGTDVHIVKGEYPVNPGLVLGRVPIGVIDSLGPDLDDEYEVGQRVLVGSVTPCGQCFYCLNGAHAQCHGAAGGWRFGNTIDGSWAEYLLVPNARANMAPIPDTLTDEDVLLVPDVLSAGIAGAENGNVRVGDSVAVFAQGPIGLCATLGAKLRGAGLIVAVDCVPERLELARKFGVTIAIDPREEDAVQTIRHLTHGRGVDVAIEALGRQDTFESALRSIRPGGTLSSLGVYTAKVVAPYEAWCAGIGDQHIVTTLCPGGKERMRRLMALVENHRVDLSALVTHRFALDDVQRAYELFAAQADGVMKIALHPGATGHPDLELATSAIDMEC